MTTTPAAGQEPINFTLLADLAKKPHPLLHIADCLECQIGGTPPAWIGEVMQEARTSHHLLDMVGIPDERGYASDLDARTYLAIRKIQELREQLDRIQSWHSRESGPAGTVGDLCTECGTRWPCDTRRMADGTYAEDQP